MSNKPARFIRHIVQFFLIIAPFQESAIYCRFQAFWRVFSVIFVKIGNILPICIIQTKANFRVYWRMFVFLLVSKLVP